MYKTVILKKGKESSILRFHPWIFSGAIERVDDGVEEGDIVRVVGHDRKFLAVGHYQIGSIAVRILSFDDITIDADFWRTRLKKAYEVRKSIGVIRNGSSELITPEVNTTYRLVHGEGDNLPGLIIDIYGDTAVMQAHSVGMHVCRQAVAEALVDVMGDNLHAIYYKSETTLPLQGQSRSGKRLHLRLYRE